MKAKLMRATKALAYALVGGLVFWTPNVVVHWIIVYRFSELVVIGLTVLLPVTTILFFRTFLWPSLLQESRLSQAVFAVLGIWITGPSMLTFSSSYCGGRLSQPDAWRFFVFGTLLFFAVYISDVRLRRYILRSAPYDIAASYPRELPLQRSSTPVTVADPLRSPNSAVLSRMVDFSDCGSHNPITRFDRSRWRGGRYACSTPRVMLQRGALNDFIRFRLILATAVNSVDCRRKSIQIP